MKGILMAFGLLAVGSAAAADRVQETMTVQRCQAVLKDGRQCPYQAQDGKIYCWRHRGAVKAVRETADGVSEGACDAWKTTKAVTTNAWQGTKEGVNKAWNSTRDAFDEAGQELRKVFRKDPNAKGDR